MTYIIRINPTDPFSIPQRSHLSPNQPPLLQGNILNLGQDVNFNQNKLRPRGFSDQGPGPTRPSIHPLPQRQHPYSDQNDRDESSRVRAHSDPRANISGHTVSAPSGRASEEGGSKEEIKSSRAGLKRRQKYRRTRTGCLCCRTRRIKCDEGKPTCRRCLIAKKSCQYPEPEEAPRRESKSSDHKRSRSASSTPSSDDELLPNPKPLTERARGKRRASGENVSGTSGDVFLPDEEVFTYPQYPVDTSGSGIGLLPPVDFNWDPSMVGEYGVGLGDDGTSGYADERVGQVDEWAGGMIGRQRWGAVGGAPMLSTPNFLLPWFPTAEERSLILHYCANAADLMMAIPSGLNPMLAINLPLALDSPRGMNTSADALRIALLGIGAIHQAFLLARSGVSTTQTAAMFQYASNLRDVGKQMVRSAAVESGGGSSDAALGAGTALATIDIFFGGSGWQENFKLAKEMVAFRGGPAEMLKRSKPTLLADGVTLSPARMLLEILAIYETFGCLTTGTEPSLISDQWEPWWFETGGSTYEEHSVEKQFGMSRMMVQLFARITRLLARVTRSTTIITEADPLALSSPHTALGPSPISPSESSSAVSAILESTSSIPIAITPSALSLMAFGGIDPLVVEARQLKNDVDAWIESLKLTTLEHERVQVGNRAYAHAMKILLLRNVFKYPREDARVQDAAVEVLRHCSTSTALLGMSIDLTWPAIIAGCCVTLPDQRQWLLTLLEGFKAQCCFDIETASRIIQEVWRRVDANEPRGDWKEVCEDLGLQVLLC
ncbi:hypothetical protein TREMEDRAFT_68786 [Tremella mesenterica DSM 1558]|uniref:uncharacterized protein n=1 Tax=Tremella mesenterica (strain ATCC 24925 / CBS 8224 / DSM 1558 / NBRC 9311 / NRRL Y-6157 / RJB 2259-6 / UBC 559-6) TaxID=578456 RepID=UPI0003F495CB|nr:uncharacterized protein TREMEDRAFT_68786 [Tremella mesenterica DSM 1558]EIW69623.1 hypothetical protein TREMEDRAFT_68786 [Tremella mesenterica DSM 1558]